MRSRSTKLTQAVFLCLFALAALSCFADGEGDGQGEGEEPVTVLESHMEFNDDLDFAQVVAVKTTLEKGESWRFDVTVRHEDEGWDHYANLWEVVDPQTGKVIGNRVLAHPHDNEQPFTRSATGIKISQEITKVLVRAKCTLHGFEGRAVLVDLAEPQGDGFTVIR